MKHKTKTLRVKGSKNSYDNYKKSELKKDQVYLKEEIEGMNAHSTGINATKINKNK